MRSLYRRSMRVAQACVPDQRSFALTYVRMKFREPGAAEPGTHAYSEKLANGQEELGRMVSMLRAKDRLSDGTAAALLSPTSPAPSRLRKPESQQVGATLSNRNSLIADGDVLREWTESDVAAWLTRLGLSEHAPAFARSRVDGRLLTMLDDEDLLELGVSSRLQRKLILSRSLDRG